MSYFLPCTDLESFKLLGCFWGLEITDLEIIGTLKLIEFEVYNEVLKTSQNFTDMMVMHKPCSFSIFQVMGRHL